MLVNRKLQRLYLNQHVWFSISRDLREDAQRDIGDLGLHIKVIDGCQELDSQSKAFGLSSEFKEGVLFTTYSTLIGEFLTHISFDQVF